MFLINIFIWGVALIVLYTQIIYPMLKGEPLFPVMRSKKSTQPKETEPKND